MIEFIQNINWEAVFVVVLPILMGVGYIFLRRLINNPSELYKVFPSIQPIIEFAVRFAANQVEYLERTGEIYKFIDEYKDKGEAKLNLAVDYAVGYIEIHLKEVLGMEVDIPEAFIKSLIQTYVWENPNLFPSTPKANEPVLQPEQTLDYSTKHGRLFPANYPANLYKEPTIEVTDEGIDE